MTQRKKIDPSNSNTIVYLFGKVSIFEDTLNNN